MNRLARRPRPSRPGGTALPPSMPSVSSVRVVRKDPVVAAVRADGPWRRSWPSAPPTALGRTAVHRRRPGRPARARDDTWRRFERRSPACVRRPPRLHVPVAWHLSDRARYEPAQALVPVRARGPRLTSRRRSSTSSRTTSSACARQRRLPRSVPAATGLPRTAAWRGRAAWDHPGPAVRGRRGALRPGPPAVARPRSS